MGIVLRTRGWRVVHTLQNYIIKGQLEHLNADPALVAKLANRAIFVGENADHKLHPLQYVSDCLHAGKFSDSIALGIMGVLIENGANINGYGGWKEDTPLLAAIGYYQTDIAHFLLDKGADYTQVGFHGATALHWAAWTGQDSLVSALLQFPVDYDVPDHDFGATPLLYGIHGYFRGGEMNERNQIQCIRILLSKGANPYHKDKEGNDAWQYIKGRQGHEIFDLLPKQMP
ncbi:ankyrin repeat domain-containing protein [Portibacter marinus]|uniref:ankyrin repeat domain-containing protein n=1 Tax=Portibacter marinus TaxID=2898660 RepID=UPI001F195098|nr:ankyrin repeat domain-containing protein [Portibacter marinus]